MRQSRISIAFRRSPPRAILAVILLLVAAGGCGPRLPAGKVRVAGTVTYDSQPLAADAVVFAAAQGTESMSARVRADGGFTVVLTPGEYAVSVLAKDGPDTMDEKGNVTVAPSLIPKKYTSPTTSGLAVVVTKDARPLSIALER